MIHPEYTVQGLLQAIEELPTANWFAKWLPDNKRTTEQELYALFQQRVLGRAKHIQRELDSQDDIASAKLIRCACGEPMVCPECTAKLSAATPAPAMSGDAEYKQCGWFLSGPHATNLVITRDEIEEDIARMCKLTGDDPDDYTATPVYVKFVKWPDIKDAVRADCDSPAPDAAGDAVRVTDANVFTVIDKLSARSALGVRKYGVTTERPDLSQRDWLLHLQEELMDAAVYVQAALANPPQSAGTGDGVEGEGV